MKKLLVSSLAVAALLVGGIASAATFSNVTFSNGDTSISGTGGSTVNVTLKVTVGAGETVEFVRTTAGSQPFQDTSVGGTLGLQEGTYDVTIPVKLPPNTGTYNLDVQGAGIYGGIRAINGADNVVGSNSFGSSLRVVSQTNASSTGSAGSEDSILSAIWAWIQAQTKPVTPAPSTSACTVLTAKLAGTSYGVYNDANVSLQGYLLSANPNSIPALKAGSTVPMGFYGPQTAAALTAYKSANSCN